MNFFKSIAVWGGAIASIAWSCAAGQPATAPAIAEPLPKSNSAANPALGAGTIFVKIPAAAYEVTMTLIPGDEAKGIKPFYLATTEVTWQAFDPYLYRLDEGGTNDALPANADTKTRPSKPYLPPDRGFGHDGYAAITMSFKNARAYCEWLTKHEAKTGGKRVFRLPTEQEWEYAAKAGSELSLDAKSADAIGWFVTNAEGKTHPVASKKPNAWGLYDMLGNAAEWVVYRDKAGNEKGGLMGGSFLDEPGSAALLDPTPNNPDWNGSDPQIPKSPWWLADGPFVGFRIACDVPSDAAKPEAKPEDRPKAEEPKPVIKSQ